MDVYITGTGQRVFVHGVAKCKAKNCVIHNPSDHHMKTWPTHWRDDRHMMERLCEHGIGHPDPDDLSKDRQHGCDGCCTPPKVTKYPLTYGEYL